MMRRATFDDTTTLDARRRRDMTLFNISLSPSTRGERRAANAAKHDTHISYGPHARPP